MEPNPGEMLDDLGVTCEMLYNRFVRVGNPVASQAVWDALQEFNYTREKIEQHLPDDFGSEA